MKTNFTEQDLQFYPTPKSLLDKITDSLKWNKITSVLEPSAGKGDIADYVKEKLNTPYTRYDIQIDCIEKDPALRKMLEGKEYHVIHDDFLTYHGQYHYDLIILNPPFNEGDKHLEKALDIQKNGGNIICILNAETIDNPCTNRRKALIQKLEKYQADISYYDDAFVAEDTDRKTNIRIAVVKVQIPEIEFSSQIYEKLKQKQYSELQIDEEITDVAVSDLVKNIVKQYELEVDAGIALIREYKGMKKYIMSSIKEEYTSPMLTLKVGDHDCSENAYIYSVRRKYWNALFRNEEFMKNMTDDQQQSYLSQVDTLIHYDFSFCNIKEIQIQMAQTMVKGIEECIIKMFDECSNAHSWYPECSKNIHYYNGWCTNKAWIVNQKVILPISIFYKDYSNTTKISTSAYYHTCNVNLLHDLEKAFNYLGGTPQTSWDSYDIMRYVEKSEQIKNVRFRYFTVNFFKKGTAHITFTDENLDTLKRFNIFGSQQKGWLPPSYGKKKYQDMTPEEKSVINEFQGEDDYRYTLEHADQFIYDPKSSVPLLTRLS